MVLSVSPWTRSNRAAQWSWWQRSQWRDPCCRQSIKIEMSEEKQGRYFFFDYELISWKNQYFYCIFFSHPANLVRPGHLGVLRDLRDHALVRLEVDCNLFTSSFNTWNTLFISIESQGCYWQTEPHSGASQRFLEKKWNPCAQRAVARKRELIIWWVQQVKWSSEIVHQMPCRIKLDYFNFWAKYLH